MAYCFDEPDEEDIITVNFGKLSLSAQACMSDQGMSILLSDCDVDGDFLVPSGLVSDETLGPSFRAFADVDEDNSVRDLFAPRCDRLSRCRCTLLECKEENEWLNDGNINQVKAVRSLAIISFRWCS